MTKLDIEAVVTSYNRWHLLQPCIESLLKVIPKDIKVTIIEDSVNSEIKEKITSTFGNRINSIFNKSNIGQIKSIDKAYAQVNSKYILKVEDDYLFSDNKEFIDESIDILESNLDVNNVYIRHRNNFLVSHGPNYEKDLFESQKLTTSKGSEFLLFNKLHCGDWCGFTFMPHIHRTDDYRRMFPAGYFAASGGHVGVLGEKFCNDHIRNNFPFRAAILYKGACETKHNETTYK